MASLYQSSSLVPYRQNVEFKSVESTDLLVDNITFASATGNNLWVNSAIIQNLVAVSYTGTNVIIVDETITDLTVKNMTGTNVGIRNIGKNAIVFNNGTGSLAGIPTGGNNTMLMTDNTGNYFWGGSAYNQGTNVVFGRLAGSPGLFNETATRNTVIGTSAGQALTSGQSNVLIGLNAGSNITSEIGNICIGESAGGNNNSSYNTCIGYQADNPFLSGYTNSMALGANSLIGASNQIMLGDANVNQISVASTGLCDIGSLSKPFKTIYANNIEFDSSTGSPYSVLLTNGTGNAQWRTRVAMTSVNMVWGAGAGNTGILTDVLQRNTLVGQLAGSSIVAPNDTPVVTSNTAFGYSPLTSLLYGTNNTAFGSGVLQLMTGCDSCTAFGSNSGRGGAGYRLNETYVGNDAGRGASVSTQVVGNTFVGASAGTNITTAIRNVGEGANALGSLTTGFQNVAIGHSAGLTGTAITTGSRNVLIGYNSGVNSNSAVNRIVIGADVIANTDNTVKIGDSAITLIGVSSTGTTDLASTAKPLKGVYATTFTGTNVSFSNLNIPSSSAFTGSMIRSSSSLGDTTWVDINEYYVAVPLSSANILAMYATPVQIVAAPSANVMIMPHSATITTTQGTQYAGGGVPVLQWGNTANGLGQSCCGSFSASMFSSASNKISNAPMVPITAANSTVVNGLGIFISNQTAAFTTGTGVGVVYLKYRILPCPP